MTEEIRAAIDAHGPIPFEQFMELALYGRQGFYTHGGSAGRRGDFITSPEIGPLFGAVVGRFLDSEWERLGRPDPFTVVDAGAGPGTLARAVLTAAPACSPTLRYVAVEISDALRDGHPADVESQPVMPTSPFVGVVLANELLDNLPFRLVVYDGGWREAYVGTGRDGSFAEVLSDPLPEPPGVLPPVARHGARAPLIERAAGWVDDARARVRRGAVVVLDYSVGRTADLAARPWRDWLRTYQAHQRGAHYLAQPGRQDITCDITLDQLPATSALRPQQQWLRLHGVDDLVDEGRRVWTAEAARPGLDAIRMRSRVSEAEALLDLDGLGGFTVAEWRSDSGRDGAAEA